MWFLKNEQKTRPINKGRFTMADKYIKKCSTFVTKEMQVNTKERCYFAPSKMAIIKKTNSQCSMWSEQNSHRFLETP